MSTDIKELQKETSKQVKETSIKLGGMGNTQGKVSESWTMFLTIDNNKTKTDKFIKKVVYHLDPSFK